jgi:hypothetical protein
MKLPSFEMLLGSTPVLFVVAPFALTAAFATESHLADLAGAPAEHASGMILT